MMGTLRLSEPSMSCVHCWCLLVCFLFVVRIHHGSTKLQSEMVLWRAVGINYVRYSQIASHVTRKCSKVSVCVVLAERMLGTVFRGRGGGGGYSPWWETYLCPNYIRNVLTQLFNSPLRRSQPVLKNAHDHHQEHSTLTTAEELKAD